MGISAGKARQGQVNSLGFASLNSSGKFWAMGVAPGLMSLNHIIHTKGQKVK